MICCQHSQHADAPSDARGLCRINGHEAWAHLTTALRHMNPRLILHIGDMIKSLHPQVNTARDVTQGHRPQAVAPQLLKSSTASEAGSGVV